MANKEPGDTGYGFFRFVDGRLMLVVSDEDIRDRHPDDEEE